MKTASSTAPTGAPNFFGLSRVALIERLAGLGEPAYRANQIFAWVYGRRRRDPADMSDLPAGLRESFPSVGDLSLPRVDDVRGTRDGMTRKFVLELRDGARVECVSMRTEKRLTFCLSSQVGCALGCTFCATGLMGLKRNLEADEIVAQVIAMGDHDGWQDERFNLVFMGMGEPLANYRPVMESIRILRDPFGLNLGARRITVSTSGVVPQIRKLADEGLPLGLAISLHATTDELRDRLVPINRRWPIADLIAAARHYGETSGRRVTLEYTLLAGVNDRAEDAVRLGAIARDLPSKVNLIAYNPVPGLAWERPSIESVDAFARRLWPIAPAVTVRHTQGGEIWAACGQLGGLSPAA